jgi:hypothetical protein
MHFDLMDTKVAAPKQHLQGIVGFRSAKAHPFAERKAIVEDSL